jgi:guanylate kinase
VSYTTRHPRQSEIHGKDYFFVGEEEFDVMLSEDAFLESARVFDHWYGTSRAHVEELLEQGETVLLEIDWQGAGQVRARAADHIGIFILPPNRKELERRLRGRGTDSDESINRRLRDAMTDTVHWDEFDYVLISEDVKTSIKEFEAILDDQGSANLTTSLNIRRRAEDILTS